MTDPRDHATDRREFLRTTSLVAVAAALGCSNPASPAEVDAVVRRFILAIGPWTEDQRAVAEDFATRFLASRSVAEPFRARSSTAAPLAKKPPFADGPMALAELDLSRCSPDEKQLLTDFVAEIYRNLEVYYVHLGGMPNVGQSAGCEQYTRDRSQWTAPFRAQK